MANVTKRDFPASYKGVSHPYVVELSDAEAETLAVIMAKVGGSPENSPRKHSQALSDALSRAGVSWTKPNSFSETKLEATGSIHFKDYPEPPKPPFVPGHFQDSGDKNSVRYFTADPAGRVSAMGTWQRVMVMPLPTPVVLPGALNIPWPFGA